MSGSGGRDGRQPRGAAGAGRPASDVAFSPAVKAVQHRLGSRASYARMERGSGWSRTISPELARFIAERDSFYLATASADGQPYIQHRGGRPGFLVVLDERTLAFADYRGNRQYISIGNLSENDRVVLFLMDYPNRQRIKIWGRAEVVEDDPDLLARVLRAEDDPRAERVFVIHVETWDANCPKFITPRFTTEQVEAVVESLQRRNEGLEARVRDLTAKLAERQSTGGPDPRE